MPVIVILKDNVVLSSKVYNSIKEKHTVLIKSNLKDQKVVLDSLNISEFKPVGQFMLTNGFFGNITEKGVKKLENNPIVKKVVIDRTARAATLESVALINVRTAVWDEGITGSGQLICVVDTGIDYTRTGLGGCNRTNDINDGSCAKVIGGKDFSANPDDLDPFDINGHGTNVAGIIASNDLVYRGVAPDAKLVAVRVLPGTESTILQGVEWCRQNAPYLNISVISISISTGGPYSGVCTGPLETAINNASAENISVVIASGNEGYKNGISSPACAASAISVGAVYDSNLGREPDANETGLNNPTYSDLYGTPFPSCVDSEARSDDITCFTNRRDTLDLLAPGAQISAPSGDSYWRGTSQAAPHVSGAAALMIQKVRSLGYNLTPQEIEDTLANTGVKTDDDDVAGSAYPRIDALAAINALDVMNFSDSVVYANGNRAWPGRTWTKRLRVLGGNSLDVFLSGFNVLDNLSLSLVAPNGTEYVAQNIVKVSVDKPPVGLWRIKVTANSVNSGDFASFNVRAGIPPTPPDKVGDSTGGINFTRADLSYISTCDPSNGLEVVMTGVERNASVGDAIINITNATVQATDAFLTGLIIPNHKMWVTMDTKPGSGFARRVGDVSRVDATLARTKVGKVLFDADIQLKLDTFKQSQSLLQGLVNDWVTNVSGSPSVIPGWYARMWISPVL